MCKRPEAQNSRTPATAYARAVLRPRAPLALCAVLALSALMGLEGAEQPGDGALSFAESPEGGIRVANEFYEVSLAPEGGGRINSLRVRGPEAAGAAARNAGWLFDLLAERQTADLRFDVVGKQGDAGRVTLDMGATAGPLKVDKSFTFEAARPFFKVVFRFANRGRRRLAGDATPALSALIAPTSPGNGHRRIYCLNRGAGPESFTSELLLRAFAPPEVPGRPLRWLAVLDPLAQRGVGIAFLDSGARALVATQTSGGGILLSWSYPPLEPGASVTSGLAVVALQGFAALSELNAFFAADSVVASHAPQGVSLRLRLTPVRWSMSNVSIITRAYAADQRELEPCDPVLWEGIEVGAAGVAQIQWAAKGEQPSQFLHEVYSDGRKVGEFFAYVAGPGGPAASIAPLPPPAEGTVEPPPAPAGLADEVEADEEARKRGFVLWRFEGRGVPREAKSLNFFLSRGEKETAFFGLRALRPLSEVHAILGAAGTDPGSGQEPLPPKAAYTWRVWDPDLPAAHLRLFEPASLAEGETIWLAVSLDADPLAPGVYGARLVIKADGEPLEIPVVTRVSAVEPAPGAFRLWFMCPELGPRDIGTGALAKLRDYGVDTVSFRVTGGTSLDDMRRLAERAGRGGSVRLGLLPGDGGSSPAKRIAFGRLLQENPQGARKPVWTLPFRPDQAGRLAEIAESGFLPALLCERTPRHLHGTLPSEDPVPKLYLVSGGLEPWLGEVLSSGEAERPREVWLYRDLRRTDWRGEAVEFRRSLIAAAHLGAAGAAIVCSLPREPVDEQLALWHVLRDAFEEAAMYAHLARSRPALDLEDLAGRAGIVFSPERRPFRSILMVRNDDSLSLMRFRDFKELLLSAAEQGESR